MKPYPQYEIYLLDPLMDGNDISNTLIRFHLKQLTSAVKTIYIAHLAYSMITQYEAVLPQKYKKYDGQKLKELNLKPSVIIKEECLTLFFQKFPKEILNKAFPD